jgi:hypothetical protein
MTPYFDSSYSVDQQYQFQDIILVTQWANIPGGHYVIIFSISGNKFITTESGQGGPFISTETIH